MSSIVQAAFNQFGFTVGRRDPFIDLIPDDYLQSPVLPRIYRQSVGRIHYVTQMVERAAAVDGDLVECGVSIGHGLLSFLLVGELVGKERRAFGFDSFAGFPQSVEEDTKPDGSFQTQRGDYATPSDMVYRVLQDGRVSPATIAKVQLVRGFFEDTLPGYDGRIALLHLDCDLYRSYKTCLEHLYDRVVPTGLIMFDEYDDPNFPGGRTAIDEFFADKPEKPQRYSRYQYERWYVVKGQAAEGAR